MRITAVESQLARLPLQYGEWGDTFHRVTHIEIIVTDVTTDTGLTGTGFSHTSGVGGLTLKSLIDKDLGPHVIGKEVAPRPLWHDCWNHVRDLGAGGFTTTAMAAIDIAL